MPNSIDHLDRTVNFTNKEFKDLNRTPDGDVVDLSTAYIWLTDPQKEQLSEDDHSRLFDYEEEMNILMAQARAEFL